MNKKKAILMTAGFFVFAIILTIGLVLHNTKNDNEESEENEPDDGIETGIVFAEDRAVSEESLTFPDTREFTQEQLLNDYEPEGKDHYEVDEQESPYVVEIENIDEMANQYNDYYNCMNLKYYIQVYLRTITGNYDERYVATLVEGSCVNSDSTTLLTVDATLDKYPGVVLHIEYDKVNRAFGINSELGDYSLDALKKEKTTILEYDPEYSDDMIADIPAPVTNEE